MANDAEETCECGASTDQYDARDEEHHAWCSRQLRPVPSWARDYEVPRSDKSTA